MGDHSGFAEVNAYVYHSARSAFYDGVMPDPVLGPLYPPDDIDDAAANEVLREATLFRVAELDPLERQLLHERHLISKELAGLEQRAGVRGPAIEKHATGIEPLPPGVPIGRGKAGHQVIQQPGPGRLRAEPPGVVVAAVQDAVRIALPAHGRPS